MKRILLLLFMALSLAAFSQKTDLSTVNTVKPKLGQKMAWEAAYKVHIGKFHKAEEKINVYEITGGEHVGSYHLVYSGRSYADMDKERSDATAHSQDLDKTFFPYLESTRNGTYRLIDSLSLRADVVADKFIVTVRHLKMGLDFADYYRELGRSVNIQKKMKGGFFANLSSAHYDQLWDGSDQVTVSIRNLKDGFKSLEQNYYGANPPGTASFRDEYVKEYGHTAWDERVKVLEGAVVKTEIYTMKRRADLSSQ